MLVLNDSSNLGDEQLSPEENLAKLKERNQVLTDQRKLANQKELENAERSAGPRIGWQELIRRLERCNPQLLFRDGSENAIAIYALKTKQERFEAYDPTAPGWYNDHKYVGGFSKEPLPEYAHILTDDRGLFRREIRGWRSVLVRLIKTQAITYQAAINHFKEPNRCDPRAAFWFEELKEFRGY